MISRSPHVLTIFGVLAVLTVPALGQVPAGQIDDFQGGTVAGWAGQITYNVIAGGPDGPNDLFMQVVSDSTNEGHLGFRNGDQWSGNYITNDILAITMDLKNFGPEEVHMRLLTTGGGSRYASIDPVIIAPGGEWQRVMFGLSLLDMRYVEGSGSLTGNLMSINRIVFHHDPDPASGHGQSPVVYTTVGVDNITAVGPTIAGDADLDGDVDLDDFVALKKGFGTSPASWMTGDFDRNGTVSLVDFGLLKANFATRAVGAGALPEPTTLSLLAVASLVAIRRRR